MKPRDVSAPMTDDGISCVIFDLDGTLLDTLDDLAAATNYALATHGLALRTTDEVRRFVGNGIHNLIRRAVPQGSTTGLVDAVHATFDAYYATHSLGRTHPYPGIASLLAELRGHGIALCVVSNKGDYAVQPLIRHFFGEAFDVVCGEREKDGIRRKPHPDTVLACLEATGTAAENAVYVGDSEVDVATARNAGIGCITVTWGFREEAYLREQGATVFAHTVGELRALLGAAAPLT